MCVLNYHLAQVSVKKLVFCSFLLMAYQFSWVYLMPKPSF